MDLLNPSALLLLPVAAALFLLARRRRERPRRLVGNLYLWRPDAPPDALRFARRPARLDWLAILQGAVIVALVCALARPAFTTTGRRAVFIVDVSASMGARDGAATRLDAARARALAVLSDLPARSRVRLLASRTAPVDLGEYASGDAALHTAIDGMRAGAGSAALADAIDAVRTAGWADADLYVFSDRPPQDGGGAPRMHWVRVGTPADNVAMTALAVRRLPLDPQNAQALVEIANGSETARDTVVTISGDGKPLASRMVHAGPRARIRIAVDIGRAGGVITAEAASDDALLLDNRRLAAVPPLDRVRVQLVSRGNFFLEQALAANPWLTLERGATGPEAAPGRREVVVCDGCPELPRGDEAVLLLPPSDEQASGALEPLAIVARDHPLSRSVETAGVSARLSDPARDAAGSVVIARAGAVPAVIAYEHEGRRVVELNIDLAQSDLPLSTAFPILLANAIDWLAGQRENATEIVAGEPLRWRLSGVGDASGLTVTGPDGAPVPYRLAAQSLSVIATDAPGAYRVKGPGVDRVFVVNPATESESDLSLRPEEAAPTRPAARPPAPDVRTDIATPLLFAALILLAAEWHRAFRRNVRS